MQGGVVVEEGGEREQNDVDMRGERGGVKGGEGGEGGGGVGGGGGVFFFLMRRRQPRSTRFPYSTLCRAKERQSLLAKGESWPTSALSVLAKFPIEPGAEILSELRSLDGRIKPLLEESDDFRRLRVGILARSEGHTSELQAQ